jgi:hypothetical protein
MRPLALACFDSGAALHGAEDRLTPTAPLSMAGMDTSLHAQVVFTETLKQPGALQAH